MSGSIVKFTHYNLTASVDAAHTVHDSYFNFKIDDGL